MISGLGRLLYEHRAVLGDNDTTAGGLPGITLLLLLFLKHPVLELPGVLGMRASVCLPGGASAERALIVAQEALTALRLELDPLKSMVESFDNGVPFLGQTVTSTTGPGVEALSHPLETVVYVDRQGALLRSRGERLVVGHNDQAIFRLNLRRVRQVVCHGRVGMTTAFLHQALGRGIEVVLLGQDGSPGGRLSSLSASDPTVRRAQYRASDDPAFALELARSFVDGKVANMRVGLLRAERREPDPVRADVAETLEAVRLVLADAASIQEVMGHEGMATREYFRAWRLEVTL